MSESVVRQVQGLQQGQLEEPQRDGRESVVGEIHMSEMPYVYPIVLQELREERRQGNVSPQEMVSPGDLDGGTCVLYGQDVVLTVIHHDGVFPRETIVQLLQFQVFEPWDLA